MRAKEFTINIPINIKINGDGEPEISTGEEEQPEEKKTMVPPLQQKLEILKKNAGLDNVFDQEADDDEPFN